MAKDQDINFRIKAEGTEQTQQEMDRMTQSMGGFGDAAEKAGDDAQRASRGTDKLADSTGKSASLFDKATDGLASYAAGMLTVTAGLALANKLIREQIKEFEKATEAAGKHQKAMLALQFLGDYYKEKPELRKEIAEMAEYGRRPFEEVAVAAYNLRSKNAAMTEPQRMGIMMEALEMGRTDPSLPLDALVDMFSLYAKQSGVADANRIQNVLQQTIAEAGGSAADVATYMPRFLPIGMAGGLKASEAAGLWAYATTQEAEASIATTGLRAIMMGLEGKGTPEGAKLLEQMGITQDMGFFKKLDVLASQDIDLPTAELLFQREGAAMGLNILKDPSALMRAVRNVTAVDRGDIDLTRDKLEELLKQDNIARQEENKRLMEVAHDNLDASDENALDVDTMIDVHDYLLRKQGVSPFMRSIVRGVARTEAAFGRSAEDIFNTNPETLRSLQEQGLIPEEFILPPHEPTSQGPVIINNHYDMSRTIQTKDPGSTPRTGEL